MKVHLTMGNTMTDSHHHLSNRGSIVIWGWLIGLLFAGMTVFALHIPRLAALGAIFGIATVKAILVLRDYMHLKAEPRLIYLIVLVPLLLAIALVFVLVPDIVYHGGR